MSDWRRKPCKRWPKYIGANGYGQTSIKDASRRCGWRTVYVHRLTWERNRGPIPEGLMVCHHCDNPACVELSHLFLGTNGDNIRDMVKKGRHVSNLWGGHGNSPLNPKKVRAIRRRRANGETMAKLASDYSVKQACIFGVVTRRRWKHVT